MAWSIVVFAAGYTCEDTTQKRHDCISHHLTRSAEQKSPVWLVPSKGFEIIAVALGWGCCASLAHAAGKIIRFSFISSFLWRLHPTNKCGLVALHGTCHLGEGVAVGKLAESCGSQANKDKRETLHWPQASASRGGEALGLSLLVFR